MTAEIKKEIINAASGKIEADTVFKNVRYLDVFTNKFKIGNIAVSGGYFIGQGDYSAKEEFDCTGMAMVPGFIDGHIHLESSIISPQSFAKIASRHGTSAVVADPHEITNVLGCDGFDYMLKATRNLPIDVFFCVPSCVPASPFDENGAKITCREVDKYIGEERILGLAEMMNFPATISADDEIIRMILSAENVKKAVDGHAPSLRGKALNAYAAAGIKSDHECTTLSEALEKLSCGQYIMIRQGTAGRNLEALLPLLKDASYSRCFFVTDDKSAEELMENGHMDNIIRLAVAGGVRPEIAFRAASFNAAEYFGMKNKGAIAPGYIADFVLLSDIDSVKIEAVYKHGRNIEHDFKECGIKIEPELMAKVTSTMHAEKITADSIKLKRNNEKIIGVIAGEIITSDEGEGSKIDTDNDILKLCVVERHKNTGHIGVCLIKGYGLKRGAVATSIAHDSHNIIAVGASDGDIVAAVNEIIDMQGGMAVAENGRISDSLRLNIAGLMTDEPAELVADKITRLKNAAYDLGVYRNVDPFMTLSFISLPVIPKLKLTSLGVVDVDKFKLI